MKYDFESYTIDKALRELRRSGTPVPVEPKVFDLLLYLIENRCAVVGKEELVEHLWDGRIVSDAALSSCVKAARRAIGDDGQQQRLIRTVQRRGFRFVGSVRPAEDAAAAHAPPSAPFACATPVAPSAAFGNAAIVLPRAPEADGTAVELDLTLPQRPSIAVLPLQLLGGEAAERLLAGGLTHDITVRLARTRWLFVTARASAAQFQGPELCPVEIGRRLGVRYLLRGSVVVADGRLRLNVILCDTARGCEIWAERFDRRLDDLFAVQDEIGDLIVGAVESEIEQKERQRALMQPFASLDAWSAYHRACAHLYRYLPEHNDQAEAYLELAARLDPASARVQAALSFLHWQRAFLESEPDRDGELARCLDLARHAVSLDPLEPQAHWALGRALLLGGDPELAVEELRSAIELNPNYAVGQYSVAFGLMFCGAHGEGLEFVDRARRLSPYDPLTFAFMAQRGAMSALMGEAEAGAEWTARALRQPNAHFHVLAIAAWCHQLAGRDERARDYVAELHATRPGYSRDDYFRAFPFPARERATIEGAFDRIGL